VSTPTAFVLTLACPDRPGIVHEVSGFLVRHGANITESQQYGDRSHGADADRFFMRVAFEVAGGAERERLAAAFVEVADRFGMEFALRAAGEPVRTLVMVSRQLHCLNDLLFRHSTGSLPVDLVGVVSNHTDAAVLCEAHGVALHHVPVSPETKPRAEAELLRLVEELDVELVVLARYMQVLSDEVCRRLEGRVINIHHSFLPSFKGAKPYHQAHDRGVKLIGATGHYVTADLDEGPIIEQDIIRVDHAYSPTQLVAAGQDVEAQVLSRAVRWHAESRVLLNGHRTVVFR
jgi:formyltetrahydrofolate deformylase